MPPDLREVKELSRWNAARIRKQLGGEPAPELDRAVVAKFLKEHPHDFPIVLTSETELPTAYQIGVFPTYIVIDQEGKLTAAVEGDQGFSELRKLLKKAGLDVD